MKMTYTNKIFSVSKYLLILIITISHISCETNENQTVTNFTKLVMEDEFNTDGAPNSAIWNYEIGTGENGWGNNELQYYTDRPDNVVVEDGMLKITAQRESFMGAAYTSARITTKGKVEQKYGRFEARIKLPWGQGVWPAFWMLGNDFETVGWPQCGEIDIMEYRGQQPTIVHGTLHGPGYSAGNGITKSYTLENARFDSDFHIFGIEWSPDYINFYVDDVLYNQITPADANGEWVYDHPFYIILNVAVGGTFVGPTSPDTVFPQTMYVDYVRLYSQE